MSKPHSSADAQTQNKPSLSLLGLYPYVTLGPLKVGTSPRVIVVEMIRFGVPSRASSRILDRCLVQENVKWELPSGYLATKQECCRENGANSRAKRDLHGGTTHLTTQTSGQRACCSRKVTWNRTKAPIPLTLEKPSSLRASLLFRVSRMHNIKTPNAIMKIWNSTMVF